MLDKLYAELTQLFNEGKKEEANKLYKEKIIPILKKDIKQLKKEIEDVVAC